MMNLPVFKIDRIGVVDIRFVIVTGFGASLLLLSDIELLDAIAIVSVVAIQIFLGGFIWRKFRGSAQVDIAEFLGMGSAVGFSLALISSQVFRAVLPTSIAWFVLLFVAFGLCRITWRFRDTGAKPVVEDASTAEPEYAVLVICCGTLVALSTSWYWLIPTSVVCTISTAWLLLRKTIRDCYKNIYFIYKAALIPLGYFVAQVLFDLTQVETIRNSNWWSLRFGVLQDPDVVFNESIINSVQKFGSSNNIFLSGYPLQYHWLSFAWEATLGSFRDLAPFAVSGIAGPVVVMLAIMALVYALARLLSNNIFAPPAAVALVSMMCTGPIPLFRVLNPHSFSYNFSSIFLFAILFVLVVIENRFSGSDLLLFGLFVFAAVGSKVSNVAGIAIGLISIFVVAALRKEDIRKVFSLGCSSALAIAIFWFFAFRVPGSSSGSNIRVDFGEIFVQKANYSWSSGLSVLILGFAATSAMILYPLSGLMLPPSLGGEIRKLANCFAVGAGLGFVVLAVIIADDPESSSYLLGAGLAILIPFSVGNLFNFAQKARELNRFVIVVAISLGMISAFVWRKLYVDLDHSQLNGQITQSLILMIPILVALVFALCVFCLSHRMKVALASFSIVLISTSCGSFSANASYFYSAGVASRFGTTEIAEPIIGSPEYRQLLNWLKENSRVTDIVATNRQCLEVRANTKDCLLLWSLTSAISNRQSLVEGLWPPNSDSQNEERDRRISIISDFVENPSAKNRDSLLGFGVKWVVVDHSITQVRDWQPFAIERFKNPAGSILELNN